MSIKSYNEYVYDGSNNLNKISRWTSAKDVELNNGSLIEDVLGDIIGKTDEYNYDPISNPGFPATFTPEKYLITASAIDKLVEDISAQIASVNYDVTHSEKDSMLKTSSCISLTRTAVFKDGVANINVGTLLIDKNIYFIMSNFRANDDAIIMRTYFTEASNGHTITLIAKNLDGTVYTSESVQTVDMIVMYTHITDNIFSDISVEKDG